MGPSFTAPCRFDSSRSCGEPIGLDEEIGGNFPTCIDQPVVSPATSKWARSRLSTLAFGAARRMSFIEVQFAAATSLYQRSSGTAVWGCARAYASRTFRAIKRIGRL
jgi:hypothetical protein